MATAASPRRVGMFGGAFDPPHWAHRALAETALHQLGLDVLHILPTGHAWHKTRVLSSSVDRVAMCHLAFDDLARSSGAKAPMAKAARTCTQSRRTRPGRWQTTRQPRRCGAPTRTAS